jgi:hypothetical protein
MRQHNVPQPTAGIGETYKRQFVDVYRQTATKNWHDLTQAEKTFWKKETLPGQVWGGLMLLGAGVDYTLTPIESGIRSLVGEPFESATGIKGSAEKIGEWGTFAAQLAANPPGAARKLAAATRGGKVGKTIEKIASPTTMSKEAGETELLIRPRAAQLAQSEAQVAADLEKFRPMVARMSHDERIDFMRAMGGEATQNPLPAALQPVAQELRRLLDQRTQRLQSLGLLQNAITDYWPRLWKDPKLAAQNLQQQAQAYEKSLASAASKRPIRGGRASAGLMQRTYGTMQEGLNAGLEPVTDNPLDVAAIRMAGMDKWYYGTKLAEDLKAQPYVRFFHNAGDAPVGWVRLDDPVMTARLPKLSDPAHATAKAAIQGAGLTPEEESNVLARLYGQPEMGAYYAPETVARVFNNYVSQSAWKTGAGRTVYEMMREGGNGLNMLQLSLSAFHPTMVSLDATVSSLARIPGMLRRGEVGRALTAAPGAVPLAGPLYTGVRLARQGKKLGEAYLNPGGATPEMQQFVENLIKGGGRRDMDRFYHADAAGGFFRAIRGSLKEGKPSYLWDEVKRTYRDVPSNNPVVKAVLGSARLGLRTVETSIEPLMQQFVPSVKRGLFMDMSKDWLAAHPNATEMELRRGMTEIWDSIENRLGQMTYDNLFWDKTLKDTAFLTVRAVGWNLGTAREIGGGVADIIRSTNRVLDRTSTASKGLSLRAQYTIALPIVVAINGAMINYMFTGQGPRDMMDYFFPRTGKMVPGTNQPERVSIPSYIKDVVAFSMGPGKTVLNKLHPMFELAQEYWSNRYYYGGIIRDPHHGDPAMQSLEWAGRSVLPFGIRGALREAHEGKDIFPLIMSELGFVPAPAYITNPQKGRAYQEKEDERAWRLLQRQKQKGLM